MKNQETPGFAGVHEDGPADWREIVRRYQVSSRWRAAWQLSNTLLPYAALWVAMYFSLPVSYWLAIPLAILAGAFLVRTFVIFHDCTHLSFFRSKRANEIAGFLTGILVFTPYHQWRWEHAIHHSSAGDLDRRGMGDVWTLTVQEYLDSSRGRRFAYRLSRNPVILFGIAPLLLFLVLQRFPARKADRHLRRWVHATNLGIALIAAAGVWAFGWLPYLILQLTAMLVASIAGVWLFYVQHQFEGVYWERRPDWDFAKAALEGSSFYKLPGILKWFSGNIGYHHIHHLSPRIPNYELERAHMAEPMFRGVKPLTFRGSLKSLGFRLWDESRHKLTGYRCLKSARRK
ncbi:fatty acid desaturase [Luteolibacter sp. GHJ8]|uniref:Fatty acid desaturase n=1 Tax=Luteolibacter rhizosphaerae TaxID=2989719 RepID=A0ABT3G8W3_9BACT|nr:fatty acid desaturase [Luteolibacter rhizosphaerae]MCW1916270.1 fatty acid desaturase [Luteolibacter rhizosphaerae]